MKKIIMFMMLITPVPVLSDVLSGSINSYNISITYTKSGGGNCDYVYWGDGSRIRGTDNFNGSCSTSKNYLTSGAGTYAIQTYHDNEFHGLLNVCVPSTSPNCLPDVFDRGYDTLARGLADVNGDGRDDFCRIVGPSTGKYISCLTAGAGGFSNSNVFNSFPNIDLGYGNLPRTFIDVNGDSRADYCRFIGNPIKVSCLLAGANGFEKDKTFDSVENIDVGWDYFRQFVDVNGDKKGDYCRFVGSSNGRVLSCMLAGSDKFGAQKGFNSGGNMDIGYDYIRKIANVNGLGGGDYCRFIGNSNPNSYIACMISSSTGFGWQYTYTSISSIDIGYSYIRDFVDVNGDKSADYCRIVSSGSNMHMSCMLSNGTGFSDKYGYNSTSASFDRGFDYFREFGDVNGDGKQDFCRIVAVKGYHQLSCMLGGVSNFGNQYGLNWKQ